MRRVVSVFLPNWPIDRLKRQRGTRDDAMVLLAALSRGRQIVAHRCPHSAARGVVPGMTLAHARALLSGRRIIVGPHDPQHDAAALRALASWAVRFTPRVAPDPPDGVLMDVTGCHRLYGDEARLLRAVGDAVERLGLGANLACAGTIGCAWAVARYGGKGGVVVPPGLERKAIEPLPVESLRLDERCVEALHEVNVDRVAQVLALPRSELAARYPTELLLRVDQALGHAAEVVQSIQPHEPVCAERVFDGAVTQLEALLITGRELIDETVQSLAQVESGAVRVVMSIERLGRGPVHLEVRLSRPSRNAGHLWALLRPRLETVNMAFGVERMALTISAAQRMAHRQEAHWTDPSSTADANGRASGELIDTLSHRLGAARAVCMRVVASHVPERAVSLMSAISAEREPVDAAAMVDGDRPSRLLDRPEPIEVTAVAPEGPPAVLRWRGGEHRLVAARGPHRLAGEWWRGGHRGRTRDYFAVQDEAGRWLWVFRASEGGRWFIHGQWA